MSGTRIGAQSSGARSLGILTLIALATACAPGGAPPASGPAPATPSSVVRAASLAPLTRIPPGDAIATPAALRFADSVLALLPLEEKIGQLNMGFSQGTPTGPRAATGGEALVRTGRIGSFLSIYGAKYTRDLQRIAVEQSPHHIPLLFAHDVIHGFRTIFPVPLAEAASFDSALAERDARIAAIEATAAGLHWTFAPMVDIARDPRWGRIVEGSGEDPYLGSVMAVARVRGFQGDDLAAPNTMMATAKHFAAYGAAEGGRDYNTAEVSEHALWATYLPPFYAAVRAGTGSIMSSFNDIGGVPAHASRWLLGDVLRARWGFRGVVVSDWAGVEELIPHGVAATKGDAAALALRAGVDIDMSDAVYVDSLAAAVRDGRVAMAAVDSAVRRVLLAKRALGLFADPYRYSDEARERSLTMTPANVVAAREAARESIVLLENRGGALPLRRGLGTIAVIGPLGDDARSMLGPWAAAGRAEDAVTVLEGIRRAAGSGTRVTYARGAPVDTVDTTGFAEAVRVARGADAVVLVLGEREDMTAEANSRAFIGLPGAQLQLAQAVTRAVRASGRGAPVIAVLVNGRPLATPWLADSASALLETWFLGVQHGTATADVVFGDYAPGGKMPVTVPRATGQIPIYYDHRNTGRPPSATDHYTSKYIDLPWTPLYPFGHGLSYTMFRYGDVRLTSDRIRAADSLGVSVDVTNLGRRAGDEVVQLYVHDDHASIAPPIEQLRRFRRITLRPGETRTVRFTLGPDDLALWDARLRRVVEPGTFEVRVGTSSAAWRGAAFRVDGDTLVVEGAAPRFH